MIIDHELDSGTLGDWGELFGHPATLFGRCTFGPELDDVRPASAKLPHDHIHGTSMEIGCIDERVEAALSKRLHAVRASNPQQIARAQGRDSGSGLFLDQFAAGSAQKLLDERG